MRAVKMLGLAAAAALAAMALLGAGSASATTLCSANEEECASPLASGTVIKAESADVVFVTNLQNITCSGSKLEGKTTAASGEPLTAQITGLTLTGCKTASGASCTHTTLSLPWAAAFEATGGGNGALTLSSGGSGNPGWTYVCGLVMNCTVSTPEATLSVEGGEPATLRAEEVELESSGGNCPAGQRVSATYTVTSPNPLFVSAS